MAASYKQSTDTKPQIFTSPSCIRHITCVVNCTNRPTRRNKRWCFGLMGKFLTCENEMMSANMTNFLLLLWYAPPAQPPPHTCSASAAAADLDSDSMFMCVFVTDGLVLTEEKILRCLTSLRGSAEKHSLDASVWVNRLLFAHYTSFFDLEIEEDTKLTLPFSMRLY